jgi:hypothetical protein
MARSKQNFAQKILGLITYGMPAPVRQVVTSRWIAMLIVIVVPILVVSGVLSISRMVIDRASILIRNEQFKWNGTLKNRRLEQLRICERWKIPDVGENRSMFSPTCEIANAT